MQGSCEASFRSSLSPWKQRTNFPELSVFLTCFYHHQQIVCCVNTIHYWYLFLTNEGYSLRLEISSEEKLVVCLVRVSGFIFVLFIIRGVESNKIIGMQRRTLNSALFLWKLPVSLAANPG